VGLGSGLLDCCAVCLTLKVEAACSSERFVYSQRAIRLSIPEVHYLSIISMFVELMELFAVSYRSRKKAYGLHRSKFLL
jgi:hypothetical protein